MSNQRISDNIPGFNTYINDTDTFLQAISSGIIHNWERLGLTNANATGWQDRRVEWRDTLYPKYTSPLLSTSAVKTQVHDFMDDFRTFANPLLNIMAASPNATSDDEAVFNFKIGRAEPSHSTTSITDTVIFKAEAMGGGDMRFTCRTSHDDHRASLAEGADVVQLAFAIQGKETSTQPPPPPGGAVEAGAVPNPIGMMKETFSKSIFVKHFGADNVGAKLVVFLRWFNTKHPDLAGPWSPITLLVIA